MKSIANKLQIYLEAKLTIKLDADSHYIKMSDSLSSSDPWKQSAEATELVKTHVHRGHTEGVLHWRDRARK